MRRAIHAFALAAAGLGLAVEARAQASLATPAPADPALFADPAPAPTSSVQIRPSSPGGFVSVTVENDLFAATDRDYTNGIRFDYITEKNDLSGAGRFARRNLGWLTEAKDWYEIYALGQNMYTPSDISDPNPGPQERPYAGFLYGSFGVVADRGDRLDTLALDVGVVGDPSLSERSQKIVHDIIDAPKPVGWDDQLETEPAFRLLYERKYRFGFDLPLPVAGFGLDAAPHGNLSLGTVDTSAGLGVTFRLGRNLDDDYGPPRVRPAVAGPGFFDSSDGFGWYIFAGVEGRVVGRNLFLQGNTFGGVDGVEIHPYVADVQLGAAIQYGPVEMSYTHVLRSEEYPGQDRWGEFGSLNLRANF